MALQPARHYAGGARAINGVFAAEWHRNFDGFVRFEVLVAGFVTGTTRSARHVGEGRRLGDALG